MRHMKNKTLKELIEVLGFQCLTSPSLLDKPISGAYTSDLLSDVMGKAQPGMVWITSQTHKNIVAVASLIELCAIVVVNERTPNEDTLETANQEQVVVIQSDNPVFETTGLIYNFLKDLNKQGDLPRSNE